MKIILYEKSKIYYKSSLVKFYFLTLNFLQKILTIIVLG